MGTLIRRTAEHVVPRIYHAESIAYPRISAFYWTVQAPVSEDRHCSKLLSRAILCTMY